MLWPVIHKCLITATQESHCFTAVQQHQVIAISLAVVPYGQKAALLPHYSCVPLLHVTAQGDVITLHVS